MLCVPSRPSEVHEYSGVTALHIIASMVAMKECSAPQDAMQGRKSTFGRGRRFGDTFCAQKVSKLNAKKYQ